MFKSIIFVSASKTFNKDIDYCFLNFFTLYLLGDRYNVYFYVDGHHVGFHTWEVLVGVPVYMGPKYSRS